ncbi:hypothetical protein HGA64_04460, partial [Candidatus Falkowbacteria bacterium]|nr:hypothetical protein [Candidatus Falkowbacteria bacterium]
MATKRNVLFLLTILGIIFMPRSTFAAMGPYDDVNWYRKVGGKLIPIIRDQVTIKLGESIDIVPIHIHECTYNTETCYLDSQISGVAVEEAVVKQVTFKGSFKVKGEVLGANFISICGKGECKDIAGTPPYAKKKTLVVNVINNSITAGAAKKSSGKILLPQGIDGVAWYVNPSDLKRYYFGTPEEAFIMITKVGTPIADKELKKIPSSTLEKGNAKTVAKYKGRILIQTDDHGKAWYLNPADGIRYYLGRPEAAFDTLKKLGQKTSAAKLNQIAIKTGHDNTFAKYFNEELGISFIYPRVGEWGANQAELITKPNIKTLLDNPFGNTASSSIFLNSDLVRVEKNVKGLPLEQFAKLDRRVCAGLPDNLEKIVKTKEYKGYFTKGISQEFFCNESRERIYFSNGDYVYSVA